MEIPETRSTFLRRLRNPEDNLAWRQFVTVYGPIVYRLARRKGLDRTDAELLVQDFLEQMVESLPGFRYDPSRGKFRKYVATVALNQVRGRIRRAGSEDKVLRKYGEEAGRLQGVEPDSDAGDDKWWATAEYVSILRSALDQLHREEGGLAIEIFELLVFEGIATDEVARRFGKSRNQIYGCKFRVMERLKELARKMVEDWDA